MNAFSILEMEAEVEATQPFSVRGEQRPRSGRATLSAPQKMTTTATVRSSAATSSTYPIGIAGQPWGATEVALWRARQVRQRSYSDDVIRAIDVLRDRFDVERYGEIEAASERFPLFAVRNRTRRSDLPVVLVTGGVHGYETSGVQGALRFLAQHATGYDGRIELLVAPCVSPWAYEYIQRWNPHAVDPNRSFRENSPSAESAALMRLVAPLRGRVLLHVDLHETTDTDESEFMPALAARDGKVFESGETPDGFYVVDDASKPQPELQQAVIAAVAKITHIAPADAHGKIIGTLVSAPGVIRYPLRELGLCAGFTDAPFCTTTEVYPDSPFATAEQCNQAQVIAVCAAIDFALAHQS